MLLEAQLEQAHRLNSLGKLAATVAHEFNNVLMGIQPFADLMKRPNVSHEMLANGARHIANSIARGKRVALDILRFTNPATPSLESIDVAEWWQQLAPEMCVTLGDHITLTSTFAAPLAIHGDAVQLAQVFTNLVSNARDAMPDGGSLRVSARRGRPGESFAVGVVPHPERFVYFTFEDTGIGMTENVLAHAFDPLFTTKPSGSTGLGLAVAHQTMQAHGGHIFVESTSGVGTTFHLFIPAAEAGDAIPANEPDERRKLWNGNLVR
jgi:two-component system cell cycle sensor histidine kinase/response regulator CckA